MVANWPDSQEGAQQLWRVGTPRGRAGFSLAELLVVITIIGVLAALGTPYFVRYWQYSKLRAGAEELTTLLNQGRQIAISVNTTVCVTQASNRVQMKTGANPCASGTVWTGPGTDASGNVALANGLTVTAGSVVFNYLGAATTTGTFTVRNATNGCSRSVVVASTGRITMPNPPPCP
jgi:prepilin-type N-terminal cleavage/methylation domain-containing protein